jgi:hypothetical protein
MPIVLLRLRGCQPYAPTALYPQEDSWYSFQLEAESTPGPQCRWKNKINRKFNDFIGNRIRTRTLEALSWRALHRYEFTMKDHNITNGLIHKSFFYTVASCVDFHYGNYLNFSSLHLKGCESEVGQWFASIFLQESYSSVRAPSRPIAISLFFPIYVCALKWGLLFDERRGWTFCDCSQQSSQAVRVVSPSDI